MSDSTGSRLLLTVFGLNRVGRILYLTVFVIAVPALVAWTVVLPRLRFSDDDERLFRAARHGDTAAAEQSLAAGAHVNAASPVDGRTALFRAAVFGHADVVKLLAARGADLGARADGQTALELVNRARAEEKDAAAARALDRVATVLRSEEPAR